MIDKEERNEVKGSINIAGVVIHFEFTVLQESTSKKEIFLKEVPPEALILDPKKVHLSMLGISPRALLDLQKAGIEDLKTALKDSWQNNGNLSVRAKRELADCLEALQESIKQVEAAPSVLPATEKMIPEAKTVVTQGRMPPANNPNLTELQRAGLRAILLDGEKYKTFVEVGKVVYSPEKQKNAGECVRIHLQAGLKKVKMVFEQGINNLNLSSEDLAFYADLRVAYPGKTFQEIEEMAKSFNKGPGRGKRVLNRRKKV